MSETTNVGCIQCGDFHSPSRCPWANTCAECLRTNAELMAEPRLCVDCAESMDRAAQRDHLDVIREGRGDYLRDMQRDGAL